MSSRGSKLSVAAFVALLPLACGGVAHGQAFPSKPIRLIAPFAPGGSTDVVARVIAQKIGERWNTQVVVDNRAGAGGVIGTEIGARASADGYTWCMGTASTLAVNPNVYAKLPFNTAKDFIFVSMVALGPFVLVAHPGVQAGSMKELVALARSRPGKLTFASSGPGSVVHMSGELLKLAAGINLTHIPFKGGGPAAIAMLGGEVDLMVNDLPPVLAHIRSGRLKAIAAAMKQRSSLIPDIPTMEESGVRGAESASWFGMLVPAGTPPAVVAKINTDLGTVLRSADYRERLAQMGMEPVFGTSEEFTRFVREEHAKWAKVAKAANIRIE